MKIDRKKVNWRFLIRWLAMAILCSPGLEAEISVQNTAEDFVFLDYEAWKAKRDRFKGKDSATMPEYQEIIAKADEALRANIVTVIDKKRVAPSGDKRDYLSLAPYWWPDPSKPDGLPYIRHDGKVNPTTRDSYTDYTSKQVLFRNLPRLVDGYGFTQESKYRERALKWLQAWFVNPATRMNPNLNYAQGIPGINDGRCFGIIEWVGIGNLITPIQLLRTENASPAEMEETIVQWFDEYARWLQTSELGQEERTRTNNHGTWYDVQLTAILLFLGKIEEARSVLESTKDARIAIQIEPDGSQPREIERTKSLSYSAMNLRAFTQLAVFGKKLGVDLWNFETPDGRSIPQAYRFLKPFVLGDENWPHPQLGDIDKVRADLRSQMEKAESQFGSLKN